MISFIANLSNREYFLEKIDALVLYIKIQLKYKLTAAHRWPFNIGGH